MLKEQNTINRNTTITLAILTLILGIGIFYFVENVKSVSAETPPLSKLNELIPKIKEMIQLQNGVTNMAKVCSLDTQMKTFVMFDDCYDFAHDFVDLLNDLSAKYPILKTGDGAKSYYAYPNSEPLSKFFKDKYKY